MDATQFSYSHTQPGTVVRVAIGVTVAGLMGLGAAGVGLAQVFGPPSMAWLVPVAPQIPDEVIGYSMRCQPCDAPLTPLYVDVVQ